ncbi:hypothetical protein RFW93_08120, partial [Acinetobacter baumannii]|nr:hypothetical protein [Acinetobacter baumannii]
NHFDFGGIAESGTIVIFTVSKLQNAEKSTKTSERRKKTAKAFKVTKLTDIPALGNIAQISSGNAIPGIA